MAVTFFEYPDPLVWWQFGLWLVAIFWGAFIIGLFGVGGGAIMLPTLMLLPGMTAPVAVGSIFTGALPMSCTRMAMLAWTGHVDCCKAMPMMVGSIVGAVAAQATLHYVPDFVISFLIAVLAMLAGVQTHCKLRSESTAVKDEARDGQTSNNEAAAGDETAPELGFMNPVLQNARLPEANTAGRECCAVGVDAADSASPVEVEVITTSMEEGIASTTEAALQAPPADGEDAPADDESVLDPSHVPWYTMIVIGLIAAFMSSISGTGGPLLLIPVFLLLRPSYPMKSLMGLTELFSFSMILASIAGAAVFNGTDLGIAMCMGVVATIGVALGVTQMHRLGDSSLKWSVGVILVISGIAVGIKTAVEIANGY